jgi:hypothetical protein
MKAVHHDHLIEPLKTDDAKKLFRRNLDEMRGTARQRAAAAKTMEEIRTLSAKKSGHHQCTRDCNGTIVARHDVMAVHFADDPIYARRGEGQEDYLCTPAVLDTDQGKQVLAFRIRMQGNRPVPNVSYSDIIEFIEGLGIDPRSIISFTEAKWNTPSKSVTSPGENRHVLSGQVMANLTAVLQGICGCGCGQRIDGYFADEMKAVHFDHLIEALKTDDANMLFRRNLDEMRGTVGQRAAAAKTMEEIRTLSAVLEQHHETRTPEEVVANADGRLLESRMPFRAA